MANRAIDLDASTPDQQLDLIEQLWERLSRHLPPAFRGMACSGGSEARNAR